jgi:hypothetical protein
VKNFGHGMGVPALETFAHRAELEKKTVQELRAQQR